MLSLRGVKRVTTEEQLDLIKDSLIQMAGAIVATRLAVNVIANQGTLLLDQADRQAIHKELSESVNRMEKALDVIQRLVGPSDE
jgi:hypothetical protein